MRFALIYPVGEYAGVYTYSVQSTVKRTGDEWLLHIVFWCFILYGAVLLLGGLWFLDVVFHHF